MVARICLIAGGVCACAHAQHTPYYITDGDASTMFVVHEGALTNLVTTQMLLYPLGIRDTIWLGDRDDAGGVEYDLDGTPTGNTSVGGGAFTQLLDGTADAIQNYGVECCDAPNSVTVAQADWSGQQALFDLPPGEQGVGITYVTANDMLVVMGFTTQTMYMYTKQGELMESWPYVHPSEACLAWEESSQSLWTAQNSGNVIRQYELGGALLNEIVVDGVESFGNVWGGEMLPASDCFADCDLDGNLTILDFVCFQVLFQKGDPAADCDMNGVLNILDFVCFQEAFVNGCP